MTEANVRKDVVEHANVTGSADEKVCRTLSSL